MLEREDDAFSRRVLWPLLHGLPSHLRCRDVDWAAYVAANEQHAQHVLTNPSAAIWVHDYTLLLVARSLRACGYDGRIGLFLHVPFPPFDVLATIPWASELIEAMTQFDLIGFQTQAFANNFGAAAARCERLPEVVVLPTTIDREPFRVQRDEHREVTGLRAALGDRRLLFGIDALDHTSGIVERLDAYERLLERCPDLQRQVSLLQIAVPTAHPDAELRERVEGMVGRINGRFGDTDWVPVCYLHRSYDQHVLAQLYRLADVALVTPLRDGMNLVAKEFVAAQDPAHPGVLVLSQYAGVAESFADALLTNPFHPTGLAVDIERALAMSAAERLQRHRGLVAVLDREGDTSAWAQGFLDRLVLRRLHSVD